MKQSIVKLSAILILPWFVLISGCELSLTVKKGNGNIVTKEIELNDFRKISIEGNYNVNLIPSDEQKVIVEIDENLLEFLGIDLFEDELNVNSIYNLKPTEEIYIEVYYSVLDEISSGGASVINHEDIFRSEHLEIDMAGAGAINFDVELESLDVNISGAGVLSLSGYVKSQNISMSGAGAVDGAGLQSDECEITVTGVGGAEVYVRNYLKATITGLGGITYYGNPHTVEKNVTGFGDINRGTDNDGEGDNV